MKIFTIGFTKKSAEKFFNLLTDNYVNTVLDIRVNNSSQLAGFTKGNDLSFFLKTICGIDYIHDIKLAPTKDLLDKYKAKAITWNGYIEEFNQSMKERQIEKHIVDNYSNKDNICLLCSEEKACDCHRSLVANIFNNIFTDVKITDL